MGRIVALFVVVALTALPVASCGTIKFRGHELLRNRAPDVADVDRGMRDFTSRLTEGMTGLEGQAGGRGVPWSGDLAPGGSARESQTLFQGDDAWLHWLYVAVVASALLAALVRPGLRVQAALGAGGGVGLFVFLQRFDRLLLSEMEGAVGLGGLNWEVGAYLAFAGFVWLVLEGLGVLRVQVGGRRT